MDIKVTKEEALEAYKGNATNLAADLNIVNSNISLWIDGENIPEKHALKLVFILKRDFFKEKRPEAPTKVTKRVANPKVSEIIKGKRPGSNESLS